MNTMTPEVGILLLTHRPLAGGLLSVAGEILGAPPPGVEAMEVINDTPRAALLAEARARVTRLNQGAGVLVLTDLYGATPANIAASLAEGECDPRPRVVAGVNLPMLLRALNYRALDLDALADRALRGGRDGILSCQPREDPQ